MRWWHAAGLPEPPGSHGRRYPGIHRGVFARAPAAIADQNTRRCSRRATGGRPGERSAFRPDRAERRFPVVIATSFIRVLRRPVESALHAAVGVEDAARRRAAERDRPFEGGDAVPGLEVAGERMADDPPRPSVEDHREIDEALCDRDVGDVADPELVGAVDGEVAGHERKDRAVVVAVGRVGETPPFPWVEVVLAHQPAHLLGIDHLAAVAQLGADPAVAVALERVGDLPDLGDEHRFGGRRLAGCIVGRA